MRTLEINDIFEGYNTRGPRVSMVIAVILDLAQHNIFRKPAQSNRAVYSINIACLFIQKD
jgi:hypothetical protein